MRRELYLRSAEITPGLILTLLVCAAVIITTIGRSGLVANASSMASLDPSFGTGGMVATPFFGFKDICEALAIQADGKIIASGYAETTAQSNFGWAIARYNTDGSIDSSFGTGGVAQDPNLSVASALALQPDGKIVAAGSSPGSGSADFAIARYNTDGSLDTSFGGTGIVVMDVGDGLFDLALAVAIQPDGKIVTAGAASRGTQANTDFAIVRYNSDGSVDTSFGVNGIATLDFFSGSPDEINSIAIQPDGKIVAGGFTVQTSPAAEWALCTL